MKDVYLIRHISDLKQTLGVLVTTQGVELFVCKTLELAWNNNQNNISCIPDGTYVCIWTRSNRLSTLANTDVYTYEITNVLNRSGIRIHSANYFYQLLGCIALGDAHKDINADGELDTIHSGDTINAFNTLLNKQKFNLIIKTISL